MRFDVPISREKAVDPASFSLSSFHYVRTYKYGSPLYKDDGKPGQDHKNASSGYLSTDGGSVFIGVPNMKPVMQLRVGWSLATSAGNQPGSPLPMEGNAYTTAYDLPKFDPRAEGFGEITVDLTPRAIAAQSTVAPTPGEGRRLAQMFGCAACHSFEGKDMAHVGPTWKGLFGSERQWTSPDKKKGKSNADSDYIRESILDPSAKVVAAYSRGEYAMPSYAGALTDSQIDSLVLFIETLK